MRGRIEYFKGEARFQPCGGLRERSEFVIGGHHRLIAIDLALFALRIGADLWEETGPMRVEIGVEVLVIERIDQRGPALGNMAIAKQLPHHSPVFPLGQGIIIGLAGAGFREFNQELAQERGHPPIDIFRAIIRMEATEAERTRREELFQGRDEVVFTNFLHRTHHFELGDLIDGIDRVDPFLLIPISLMHGVDADKPRLPSRGGFAALTNAGARGPRFLDLPSLAQIRRGFS